METLNAISVALLIGGIGLVFMSPYFIHLYIVRRRSGWHKKKADDKYEVSLQWTAPCEERPPHYSAVEIVYVSGLRDNVRTRAALIFDAGVYLWFEIDTGRIIYDWQVRYWLKIIN